MLLAFNSPPTAKVISRQGLNLKYHLTDSRGSNLPPTSHGWDRGADCVERLLDGGGMLYSWQTSHHQLQNTHLLC